MPRARASFTLKKLMNQEIHFITGKGGVGKSLVAAGLALEMSQQGKKTLLVEMGDQSFFRDFFNLDKVGYKPIFLKDKLDLALWSGQEALREYALHLIKVERLYKIFFENAVMKAFMNVAPALPELAIMGKITSGPRKHGPALNYDCLVIDSFATGHFMALMRAAPGMLKAVSFGPMGEQSRGIEKILRDPKICHYHIVTLPEELPLKEAGELQKSLHDEFEVDAKIIVNKILQSDVPPEDLQDLKGASPDLIAFADYLKFHLERQAEFLKKAKKLDPDFKKVPLILDSDSWKLVDAIKGSL